VHEVAEILRVDEGQEEKKGRSKEPQKEAEG